jgi:serine carboxypeptidase 1
MFWWLHYTIAEGVTDPIDRPLILWLQGGPGSSSTGFGNFEILGPLDLRLEERNFTWIKSHNVLFVDNPVGTGYSYVDHKKFLSKTNQQVSRDLIELLRGFYLSQPAFKTVPLYIFGESYGGKMGIEFARDLYHEIKDGKIESNLIGVAMGDAWISPVDSTLSWAPYLRQLGFVDDDGFEKIHKYAVRTKKAFDAGLYYQSSDLWYQTEMVLETETKGVDFYNILVPIPAYDIFGKQKTLKNPRETAFELMVTRRSALPNLIENDDEKPINKLDDLMTGVVHEALGLDDKIIWGSQAGAVFDIMSGDFMKPVVDVVADALTNTTLKVIVYNGQLDLICATPGTVEWVNNMNWYGREDYLKSTRHGLISGKFLEGYKRSHDNFTMYWVRKSLTFKSVELTFKIQILFLD